MASVNKVIVLRGDASAGASQEQIDDFSPASGEQVQTVGLATNANTNIDYFLFLNETKIIDEAEGDDLPTLDNPFRFELNLQQGDTVTLEASNEDTANAQNTRLYLIAEDSSVQRS